MIRPTPPSNSIAAATVPKARFRLTRDYRPPERAEVKPTQPLQLGWHLDVFVDFGQPELATHGIQPDRALQII